MADQTSGANAPVAKKGGNDHDRVAMLSVRKDGTPDQVDPEFIGDEEASKEATREQFRQQAVSARDVELRQDLVTGGGTSVDDAPQDPTVEKLEKEHEKVAKQAESAADSAVKALTK